MAGVYHFQPSEIDELYLDKLEFWNDGIQWLSEQMPGNKSEEFEY